jgi:hypothetical protein
MVGQLWEAGISEIFVNGSFVEDKDHPGDIDGYFECEVLSRALGGSARCDARRRQEGSGIHRGEAHD